MCIRDRSTRGKAHGDEHEGTHKRIQYKGRNKSTHRSSIIDHPSSIIDHPLKSISQLVAEFGRAHDLRIRPVLQHVSDGPLPICQWPVSYTHLRAHETVLDIVCRLLLETKKKHTTHTHTHNTQHTHANETIKKLCQHDHHIE